MSKCCRKKKSRSFSNRRESRKSQPPRSKRNTPSKNRTPLSTEERTAIAQLVKNIFQRFVPHEPDLTKPIGPRDTPFAHSRLQDIKHILDARAAQCKTAYLAKQNISTLKDTSGDDHLVAKQNPFASHADKSLGQALRCLTHSSAQSEEPQVAKKNPPPTWDETPLIGKNESRSLRPEVDEGPRPPGRPLWMPEGADLERMPVEIRQAVAEILRPAYEELVVQAGSGMEKSLGTSLVHLLWLEILEQYDMKKDYCKFDLLLELDGTRGAAIDRYLKLVNSKLRLSSMLTRLRQLRLKEQKSAPQTQNVQNSKSDNQNQMPNSQISNIKSQIPQQSDNQNPSLLPLPPSPFPLQKAPNVQNSNFDDENRTSESPSQSQTCKNHELTPKNDSAFPLLSSSFPDQKAPIVQKQEFDDQNQMPDSEISNIKFLSSPITKINRTSPFPIPPSPFRKTQTCNS